jgi:hypothetical protein
MGFDDFGERDYTGCALVSGTAYIKTTDESNINNNRIETVTKVQAFTSPLVMTPSVGDQIEVTSGPAPASGTTYLITNMRPVVDLEGFHVTNISTLEETEI